MPKSRKLDEIVRRWTAIILLKRCTAYLFARFSLTSCWQVDKLKCSLMVQYFIHLPLLKRYFRPHLLNRLVFEPVKMLLLALKELIRAKVVNALSTITIKKFCQTKYSQYLKLRNSTFCLYFVGWGMAYNFVYAMSKTLVLV